MNHEYMNNTSFNQTELGSPFSKFNNHNSTEEKYFILYDNSLLFVILSFITQLQKLDP